MDISTTESVLGVKVPPFEGPLELLLTLIKENEINIYDIPIALITQQYLATLDLMKSLNLSVAGDFLVMAATLIHIKSKTLLPVQETDEGEMPEDDPRLELVTRLLEYKKFKEASYDLEARESIWRQVFSREPSDCVLSPDEISLGDLNPSDLLDALQKVIARLPNPAILQIENDELSVRDRMNFILFKMEQSETLLFDALFEDVGTRHAVVVTFLALLEIVRLGILKIVQTEICGVLRLIRRRPFEIEKGE